MVPRSRFVLVLALATVLAGCERRSSTEPVAGIPTPQPVTPTATVPEQPAAKLPALPAVARAPVEPLPMDYTIERGQKPESTPELVKKGLDLFAANCAACHGPRGTGDGPASWAVQPRPRNFTKGLFKLHTNDNGSLPLDEDLFDTITRGMGGSAMPSFAQLPAADRWALVAAVKELTVYKDEDEDPPVEIHFFKDRPPSPAIPVGKPIAASPEMIAKGKGAYLKLDCNKCHGPQGEANGPSAKDLKDDWGEVMWPRNFQEGRFRGVKCLKNVVQRLNTGLSGTPMAAFGSGQLTEEEKWAIGHFLNTLRVGLPTPQPAPDGVLVAATSAEPVPADLRQPRFWMNVPVYGVALQGDGPKTARVALQRDGKNVAVLVAWDDPIGKEQPVAAEDFLDGVTLTLSANGKTNSWEWRGEQQRDGKQAEEKGAGASSLESAACWREGEWRVLFVRPLEGGGDRIPLGGSLVEARLAIDDRSPSGTKSSRADGLKLGVP